MVDMPEIGAGASLIDAKPARATRVSRLWPTVFLVFFALCLLLPLAQTVYPVFGTIVAPIEERRTPAPFPPLHLLLRATGDFASGLNAWFDDRVGFRDLFIRTKHQIDYSVFSTAQKVYIGKDGWLFGMNDGAADLDHLSAAEIADMKSRYVTLAERLQKKGIHLIVVGYPIKQQIYADKAPWRMPEMKAGGVYDQLREFLKQQPSLTFIDAEAILKRERRDHPEERLFHKADMHPTIPAQIPVVKAIIAQIARLDGRPDISWNEPVKFFTADFELESGSESRFLSILTPIIEPNEVNIAGNGYDVGKPDPTGTWIVPANFSENRTFAGSDRPFDFEYRSNPEFCSRRLPGTVLFGNSFSDFYWPLGLQKSFCFIRRSRTPMSRFKPFYAAIPPGTKYMIFQMVSIWAYENAPPPAADYGP